MNVLGGLWLENLVNNDQQLELQLKLFEEGLINGAQIRVAHINVTPTLTHHRTIEKVFEQLPENFITCIHLGAESAGVDLGERLDERGVFKQSGYSSWENWNMETLRWGLIVSKANPLRSFEPAGVLHPGYGSSVDDFESLERIINGLRKFQGSYLGLETVPAIAPTSKDSDPARSWWGFGGTPADMKRLLDALDRFGPDCHCLLDFTHIAVTVNQANAWPLKSLAGCRDLETVLGDYLDLSHWPVCHYSGFPPTIVDSHDYLLVEPPQCVKEAIKKMDTVCLEIPFEPNTAAQAIEMFRRLIGI